MNTPDTSLYRKVTYLIIIVVMFTLLIVVKNEVIKQADANKLTQKNLGKVNPVSGTAQLVCLGFRGMAVSMLWNEYLELKDREQWYDIEAVLKSITLLQPNFHSPWQFQAWNVAYNIASDWEAVEDKYYWIRRGVEIMKEACELNQNTADLEWYTGWIYHNKFGISDEQQYLRRIFRESKETPEFTTNKTSSVQNPFFTAFDWFKEANDILIRQNRQPKRMGVTPFMSHPALTYVRHAELLAKDGEYGEVYRDAWRKAANEWRDFGLAYGKGEPGRHATFHKLEFSPEELAQLTKEEDYWRDRFDSMVRYSYRKRQFVAEADKRLIEAKRLFYEAEKSLSESDYDAAAEAFEQAFPKWVALKEDQVFNVIFEDTITTEEAQEQEANYLRLLVNSGAPLPEKRPFEGLYEQLPLEQRQFTGGGDLSRSPNLDPTFQQTSVEPQTQAVPSVAPPNPNNTEVPMPEPPTTPVQVPIPEPPMTPAPEVQAEPVPGSAPNTSGAPAPSAPAPETPKADTQGAEATGKPESVR